MPREPQSDPDAEIGRPVEWRDPRRDTRPRDDDVRIDRREPLRMRGPGSDDTGAQDLKDPPITR